MPLLTIAQAAKQFGVSRSTLRRLTRDGTAKVKGGGKGRGRASMFDEAILAQLLCPAPQSDRRPSEVLEQLERGALALTIPEEVIDELQWAFDRGDLYPFGVPRHMHKKLLDHIKGLMLFRIRTHLKIK